MVPKLRRKPLWDIPKKAARFHSGIASTVDQIEPYADLWDHNNEAVAALLTKRVAPGAPVSNRFAPAEVSSRVLGHLCLSAAELKDSKLWLVLGDSICQGVGASEWEKGWVHEIFRRLQGRDENWYVINLSMSGGRFSDVSDLQIPAFTDLGLTPDLVTCVAGGNDIMWRLSHRPVIEDAELMLENLSQFASGSYGVYLAEVPGFGVRNKKINARVSDFEPELKLIDIWDWLKVDGGICEDRIHPTDIGYESISEQIWSQIAPNLS